MDALDAGLGRRRLPDLAQASPNGRTVMLRIGPLYARLDVIYQELIDQADAILGGLDTPLERLASCREICRQLGCLQQEIDDRRNLILKEMEHVAHRDDNVRSCDPAADFTSGSPTAREAAPAEPDQAAGPPASQPTRRRRRSIPKRQ